MPIDLARLATRNAARHGRIVRGIVKARRDRKTARKARRAAAVAAS